jgi:ABC-type polar amino acid transport system ATPase subunit
MISVRHLSKTYQNPDGSSLTVLKDINCEISPGEVISIIGPSGTGKSTFLRALNLMDPPTGGEILLNGENILAKGYPVHRMRQKIGMVFQSFNLFDHMTVAENIMFAPVRILHESKDLARQEALSLLKKVGLADKADVYPSSLSGGQKQRVAIARCLAMKPEVILFDEPTSALDPTMVGEVVSVIRQLARDGMTMLIVTHEMKFARDISTRIFFMYDGFIHEDGTPEQIFDHPRRSATREFTQRIRRSVFEIEGDDFDFQGMYSDIARFCVKNDIAQQRDKVERLCELMVNDIMAAWRPMTVRVNYKEITEEASLDFMVEGLDRSPLGNTDRLIPLCREIVEEPTSRGFRVKLLL